MSDINSALEELDSDSKPAALPKAKKSAIPGFASLDRDGKKKFFILIGVVLIGGYFIFSSLPSTNQIVVEETTGEDFTAVSISTGGSSVSTGTGTEDIRNQALTASTQEAEFGVNNDFSGIQNVEYGSWLAVDNNVPQSPVQPQMPRRMSDDSAFLPDTRQQNEKLLSNVNTLFQNAKDQSVTPTAIAKASTNQSSPQNRDANNAGVTAPTPTNNAPVETIHSGVRHLLPGDVLACQVTKAINTDVSRETTCIIRGSVLDGGRITLKITREEGYIYLQGTNLVLGNRFIGLQGALAVDTGDVAANGIRDSVDYHRLMRISALMLAGAGQTLQQLVTQQNTTTTSTGTTTTVETIKASEGDLIRAALVGPAALATDSLMEVYNTPPTVYLEKDKIIHIYFTSPVTAPWMPDLRQEVTNTFKYRAY